MSYANNTSLVPWKIYLTTTVESLLTFYLASFCIALFFTHRGAQSLVSAVIMGGLYLFVIFGCAKRIIQALPISAIMLIIPLAPLIAIGMVISLIPVLQYL